MLWLPAFPLICAQLIRSFRSLFAQLILNRFSSSHSLRARQNERANLSYFYE